jgi:hypothetical protein
LIFSFISFSPPWIGILKYKQAILRASKYQNFKQIKATTGYTLGGFGPGISPYVDGQKKKLSRNVSVITSTPVVIVCFLTTC